MAETWYADIDGATAGPFGRDRLRAMAAEGRVTAETRVRSGDGPWRRAGEVEGLVDEIDDGASGPRPGTGSQFAIPIDPSVNDTTEFRMLADTAKTEVVKPYREAERPLPRLSATGEGGSPAKAVLWLLAAVALIAAIAWFALSGR